jgi:anti-sigma B factor antagonist
MELSISKTNDQVRFEIQGDIDEPGAEILKTRFQELDKSNLRETTFDFKNVGYIGSAGIGKLLLIYKAMAEQGGHLKVENLSKANFDLFLELKLDQVFTITPQK